MHVAPCSVDGSRAVDGHIDTDYSSGSCTHTQNDGRQWWQVDLGEPYAVESVRIFHRSDCCQDRLSGATVFLSDSPDYLGTSAGGGGDGGKAAVSAAPTECFSLVRGGNNPPGLGRC